MYFNLIHRPGLSNEYRFQRECAHELGLKATMLVPISSLDNQEIIEMVKYDNKVYGDEIGIWLGTMKGMPRTMVWLLSESEKEKTVRYSIDKYKELFGCAPKVVGNYVLDAHLIKMIKEYCPEVQICVAGCFEEGVKVFHGCNNSWYLFSEGMSWNPWYPSKTQSVRPAENEDDWVGVVAVPHLSRDLVLGYEGRNDFFASHPANIQRGLANEGMIHEYDYNLTDQYRMQEDFNDGFSYYQIHVSPGWLHSNPNIIDPDDITQALYRQTLEYMVELRQQGKLVDMHMSEFAEEYKKCVPIGKADVAVGKDILYGSGKHYFWISNPGYRVLVDTFQGGSIGDLRPYAGKYESFTGADSDSRDMNSYPYVIQSQYRSGVKHHYMDGARTTLYVTHNGEALDMCMYPSKVSKVSRNGDTNELILKPVVMEFKDGLRVEIQTVYSFEKDGNIKITRNILSKSDEAAGIEFTEYVKACYGFTEYAEPMKGITLHAGNETIDYKYGGIEYEGDGTDVYACVPQINTELWLKSGKRKADSCVIAEGTLFSPYYTLKLKYKLGSDEKEVSSWLQVKQMKA